MFPALGDLLGLPTRVVARGSWTANRGRRRGQGHTDERLTWAVGARPRQCCVHVATVGELTGAHQCASFCAVQAWALLCRTRISTTTGPTHHGGDVHVTAAAPPTPSAPSTRAPVVPYDPLRLCTVETVALWAWVTGPTAVVSFAGLGSAGYLRARRAGLERSKCVLRDTRLVLAYLRVLALAGAAAATLTTLDVAAGATLTTLEVLGVR